MMIEAGSARLAAMFNDLTIAADVERTEAGVKRIERFCQRDSELSRIYDALIELGETRADVPPDGWELDTLTRAWLDRYHPDDDDAAKWFYRMDAAHSSPEGQRLCALRDARIAVLLEGEAG